MFRRHANEHERCTAAIDANVREVEAALSRRHKDMGREWDELDNHWQDLAKKRAKTGIIEQAASNEGMLWLNVGGSPVCILKDTLPATCHLMALLDGGTWDKRLPRDSDGRVVLDESPTCVKHLLHHLLQKSGRGARSVGSDDNAPAGEESSLFRVSHMLGLKGLVGGMLVTGGSTVLEASGVVRLTAAIQDWCPGRPDELRLLYRASRDGWTGSAFYDRCGESSLPTVTLFRVRRDDSERGDSILGGYSSVSWADGSDYSSSPGAFLFVLEDGTVSASEGSQPAKMDLKQGYGQYAVHQRTKIRGPSFGVHVTTSYDIHRRVNSQTTGEGADLGVHWTDGSGRLKEGDKVYELGSIRTKLHNRCLVDIETFSVCSTAATSTTPSSSTKSVSSTTTTATRAGQSFGCPTVSAEEYRTDMDTFGELIAGSIMEERDALRMAHLELLQARDKLSASANAITTLYGPDVAAGNEDPVVELNVRGSRVTTLLSTLQACPGSVLATMFDAERWPATAKDVDEHGHRLIDCSPSVFAKVLDVLRMRKRPSWGGLSSSFVSIKRCDRVCFEEFVEKYFPGDLQSFIMDHVEPGTGTACP